MFRLALAVPRSNRAKGGRPALDLVLKVKVLAIQASHSLSNERTEFLIEDRLSFMRFFRHSLADPVPDANTIRTFCEALLRAQLDGRPAIQVPFAACEAALAKAGFPMLGGQIINATLAAPPRQHDGERAKIKAGRVPETWTAKPAKLTRKEGDARWTIKGSKAKPAVATGCSGLG